MEFRAFGALENGQTLESTSALAHADDLELGIIRDGFRH